MTLRLVSAADLTALVRGCFTCSGLSAGDAVAIADVLVDANLRGTESHGISRAPVYLRRLRAGLTSGTERLVDPERSGPLCRLDAGHALGPAVGVRAVEVAAGLAAEHGIGVVAVGRSTHFGAAGYYARLAAKRGLVAIVASNGPAHMAPHGAAEPFLGTNAFAIGAPLGRHGTFSLDMASSVAARGKVLRAQALGEPHRPGARHRRRRRADDGRRGRPGRRRAASGRSEGQRPGLRRLPARRRAGRRRLRRRARADVGRRQRAAPAERRAALPAPGPVAPGHARRGDRAGRGARRAPARA